MDGYGTRVEGHNPGMVPFGDTAEVLIINYDDTTPPPDPDPDPDPKPDPDPGPDPMPDPDPHPTPDPDESPDPDMPDTPDEPGHLMNRMTLFPRETLPSWRCIWHCWRPLWLAQQPS